MKGKTVFNLMVICLIALFVRQAIAEEQTIAISAPEEISPLGPHDESYAQVYDVTTYHPVMPKAVIERSSDVGMPNVVQKKPTTIMTYKLTTGGYYREPGFENRELTKSARVQSEEALARHIERLNYNI